MTRLESETRVAITGRIVPRPAATYAATYNEFEVAALNAGVPEAHVATLWQLHRTNIVQAMHRAAERAMAAAVVDYLAHARHGDEAAEAYLTSDCGVWAPRPQRQLHCWVRDCTGATCGAPAAAIDVDRQILVCDRHAQDVAHTQPVPVPVEVR